MNRSLIRLIGTSMMLILSLTCGYASANEEAKQAAVNASKIWLAHVDSGKYARGWEMAAEYLRNAITKENFAQQLKAVRNPLGKTLSRKLTSSTFTTTLPGAPDGQYVVIQYETVFENKKSAVETITPMRDKDGKWRVSGYYIK